MGEFATLMAAEYELGEDLLRVEEKVLAEVRPAFGRLEEVAQVVQLKVLRAFHRAGVSDLHLKDSTGYGYNDIGREGLDRIGAEVFGAEAGLVRTQIVSGTHALAMGLFGVLRPGDELLAATGDPYDTLAGVIGPGPGSLQDFGITYRQVAMGPDGRPDPAAIIQNISQRTRLVLIQRSRGYAWRPSLCIAEIERLITLIKEVNPGILVLVDNCYGEFVEEKEPPQVGADLTAGSLIKNPGGGIAPGGGYIVGRAELVELAAGRLSAPGLGGEVGPSLGQNRLLYQGLFLAPQVVSEALKTAIYAAALLKRLGFKVSPQPEEPRSDIIQAIELGSEKGMIAFCRGLQEGSPVDAHVRPEPSGMPGYEDRVVMAGGTFIQGSSIELSADGPIREPYAVYLQGGLSFYHGRIALLVAVDRLLGK